MAYSLAVNEWEGNEMLSLLFFLLLTVSCSVPNLFSMGIGQYALSEFRNTAFEVTPSKSHSSEENSSKHGPEIESSDPPNALSVRGKILTDSGRKIWNYSMA